MNDTVRQGTARFWLALGLVAAAAAAVGAFLLWNDPARTGIRFVCYFNQLTGLYCPGCGASRAVKDMLTGHFLEALHHNLLAVVFIPVGAYLLIADLYAYYFHKKLPTLLTAKGWAILVLATSAVFTVLRNIPVEPFTRLAP